MHKNVPSKFPELLSMCVVCRYSVEMQLPSFWPKLGACFLQTVRFLESQLRFQSFVLEKQLIVVISCLGDCLCCFTGIRPRSFSFEVGVTDPFFITSHRPLQKLIDFVIIQQGFADLRSVHEVFFVH